MSLSSNNDERYGTIFMGPSKNRESKLDLVLDAQYKEQYEKEAEKNYLARVEAKAQEKAKKILELAQISVRKMQEEMIGSIKDKQVAAQKLYDEANKTKAEAEKIKKEAELLFNNTKETAYNEAINEAKQELELVRQDLGANTAFVIQTFDSNFNGLLTTWKKELALFLQECVEVAIAHTLSTDKKAILESFFYEALNQLEDKKRITIRTNPNDEALVNDIVLDAKNSNTANVEHYKVVADNSLESGSLIIESDFGYVENDFTRRRMEIREILNRMSLNKPELDSELETKVHKEISSRLANLEQKYNINTQVESEVEEVIIPEPKEMIAQEAIENLVPEVKPVQKLVDAIDPNDVIGDDNQVSDSDLAVLEEDKA